jgi:hypothetical protein
MSKRQLFREWRSCVFHEILFDDYLMILMTTTPWYAKRGHGENGIEHSAENVNVAADR